jgi:hypothetical protein
MILDPFPSIQDPIIGSPMTVVRARCSKNVAVAPALQKIKYVHYQVKKNEVGGGEILSTCICEYLLCFYL